MKVFDFFEQNPESFDKVDDLIFNEINEIQNL